MSSGGVLVCMDEFEQLLDAVTLPRPSCDSIKFKPLDDAVGNKLSEYFPRYAPSISTPQEEFSERLRRLRYHKMTFMRRASTLDWEALLDAWASQCCFLESDDTIAKHRMSLRAENVDNVGMLRRWVLHRDSVCDVDTCQWITKDAYVTKRDLAGEEKFCLCTVFRVPDSCVPWDIFIDPNMEYQWKPFGGPGRSSSSLPVGSPIRALISTLLLASRDAHCDHGIIADSDYTMIVTWKPADFVAADETRIVNYYIVPTGTHSTPYWIAARISEFATTFLAVPPGRQVFGALCPDDLKLRLQEEGYVESPQRRFRDFDHYEMEHRRPMYEEFLLWKTRQLDAALAVPLVAGTVLSVGPEMISTARNSGKLDPWRCPFKWVNVPDDCTTSIFARRSRCLLVDDLLSSGAPLTFRLTEDLRPRVGADSQADSTGSQTDSEASQADPAPRTAFSRVWSGHLHNATNGAILGTELCLKLFDERLFQVPSLSDYDDPQPDTARLAELPFADEMLRREEAVYTRFSGLPGETCPHLQGLCIPHFYGCYEFIWEDETGEHTVMGVLLERINGVRLHDILPEVLGRDSQWAHHEKVALLKRLRNLVKVLKHAHISQEDWHAGQILCIRKQDGPPELSRDQTVDFVMVDFAFAQQYDDRRILVSPGHDAGRLKGVLVQCGLDYKTIVAVRWDETDRWEL